MVSLLCEKRNLQKRFIVAMFSALKLLVFVNREFLTAKGLVQHKVGGSRHTWERKGGVNSSDLAVLAASKPGGILRCGVRPDRAAKTVTSDVVASADGAPGASDADCYQQFNRKEGTDRYNKTPKLKAKLWELFNVGQDSDASRLNGEQANADHAEDGRPGGWRHVFLLEQAWGGWPCSKVGQGEVRGVVMLDVRIEAVRLQRQAPLAW